MHAHKQSLSSARVVFFFNSDSSCMLITYTAAWHSKYEKLSKFFWLGFFKTLQEISLHVLDLWQICRHLTFVDSREQGDFRA